MLNDLEKKTPSVPVTPVPAATVMVLRDTPGGIEVLMVQRTKKADFAGVRHQHKAKLVQFVRLLRH